VNWLSEPVRVRVPATSANLGPGFDSLGLALRLHDTVLARITAAGLDISIIGAGAEAAGSGEQHLVVRAMRTAFAALGRQPPGISLACENAIPQGYGLGSSAGAIVAGLLAARALAGPAGRDLPDDAVLRLAARLDGHADNAAACLAGGLTVAWAGPAGFRSARLDPLPGLAPVLCVPPAPLSTAAARRVLPATVPHADAAQNAARAALLIAALTTDPAPLLDATEDFLHQPFRAAAMQRSARLMAALRQSGIPAVISGAGPAVLALTVPGATPAAEAVSSIATSAGQDWTVMVLDVDRDGAVVTPGRPGG
jgi:homoserine kinase